MIRLIDRFIDRFIEMKNSLEVRVENSMEDRVKSPSFAIVIPTAWKAAQWSLDIGCMVAGFERLGIEVRVICAEESVFNVPYSVQIVSKQCLSDPEFWQAQYLDAVVIFTWMGNSEIICAARTAGLKTFSFADTDGLVGVRCYPADQFCRMVYGMATPLGRLRAIWYWVKKVAFTATKEENSILLTFKAADYTLVQCMAAKTKLRHFLAYYQVATLDERVRVVRFPIDADILNIPVCSAKRDKIVAIGRWDDPQKDAALLAQSLDRYLTSQPRTQVVLIGRGGDHWFTPLTRRFSSVICTGSIPHREIGSHLQEARSIVFTSRWEGMPNAAHEALASGCSVVGVPIPSMESVCAAGPFGTVAKRRRPADVAKALAQERQAWEDGVRNPLAIADYWRARLSPAATAQQYIDLYLDLFHEHEEELRNDAVWDPAQGRSPAETETLSVR